MHRDGHYGAALAASGAILWAVELYPAVATIAGLLAVTMLPDKDQTLPLLSHRGITHTLLFAVVVGSVAGLVTGALWSGVQSSSVSRDVPQLAAFVAYPNPALFIGIGATGGIVLHLVVDALTVGRGRFGISPLWPVSDWEFRLGLWRASNRLANTGLFFLGASVFVASLYARVGISA